MSATELLLTNLLDTVAEFAQYIQVAVYCLMWVLGFQAGQTR